MRWRGDAGNLARFADRPSLATIWRRPTKKGKKSGPRGDAARSSPGRRGKCRHSASRAATVRLRQKFQRRRKKSSVRAHGSHAIAALHNSGESPIFRSGGPTRRLDHGLLHRTLRPAASEGTTGTTAPRSPCSTPCRRPTAPTSASSRPTFRASHARWRCADIASSAIAGESRHDGPVISEAENSVFSRRATGFDMRHHHCGAEPSSDVASRENEDMSEVSRQQLGNQFSPVKFRSRVGGPELDRPCV